MTLGEFVKEYRERNNLSQRKFAIRCGLSNGYISMLEDGKNPKTGKPLVPKIENVMKIATAMGYELGSLFELVDDMEIDISAFQPKTQKENALAVNDEAIKVALFGGDTEVTDEMWDEVMNYAEYIKQKYRKT